MRRPLLVDVGLPRTGTQAFTAACEMLGFRAGHIGFGEDDADALAEFRRTGGGPIFAFMCRFEVVSDSPYYGLIDSLRSFHPSVALVATSRSRASWLESTRRHPEAGATFMRTTFGTPDPTEIFDRHRALLDRHRIPCIALEMDDDEKWSRLTALVGVENAPDAPWPRIDLLGRPGFRHDSAAFDPHAGPHGFPGAASSRG